MKRYKMEDIMPVEAVKKQIWKTFDVLRNVTMYSEEYSVVLFLLSLYKDNLLSANDLLDQGKFTERIEEGDGLYIQQYLSIYPHYSPSLDRFKDQGLFSIIEIISNIDKKVLTENFSEIFDHVLYEIARSQGKYGGEFIQPIELTRLMSSLVELPDTSKIFNPFAGLASFGVNFGQDKDYYGQEINPKSWALGYLRIMAHQMPETYRYELADSMEQWPKSSNKFDLILAHPPLNFKIKSRDRENEPDIIFADKFFIKNGVNSLNAEGKLIALLSQRIFSGGSRDKNLREYLINKDLIDTIISLPGGILYNTGVPLVILVLDKDKKRPGKVRFFDAKKYVKSEGLGRKVLNDYVLNGVLHGDDEKSEAVRIIDNSQIKELDYNLSIPRYFQKHIEGVKLSDLLVNYNGKRVDLPEGEKMVRIRDLKNDKVEFRLDPSEIDMTDSKVQRVIMIEESCLLFSRIGKNLKPTLFEFSGTPIFLDKNIYPFKVREDLVDIAFLINELHADYVQDQLESYQFGGTIPSIKKNDLLEIVIKLSSLEEQRAKIQGIQEVSEKIDLLEKERNALAHGQSITQFNEFASLKHTLGRPRQNILDWTDNILFFLNENREGFDTLNKAFHQFYEIDIFSALKEIKQDINFMTDVLEKGEDGFVIENFDTQMISLLEINRFIEGLKKSSYDFEIIKDLLETENFSDSRFDFFII